MSILDQSQKLVFESERYLASTYKVVAFMVKVKLMEKRLNRRVGIEMVVSLRAK